MRLVENWEEIKQNIEVFDEYRWSKNYNQYYRDKIYEGICFIVVLDENGNRMFYPSRFIGYANNTSEQHESEEHSFIKNGGQTNDAISNILGKEPEANEQLLRYFKEFCEKMDIEYRELGTAGCVRKFWVYN